MAQVFHHRLLIGLSALTMLVSLGEWAKTNHGAQDPTAPFPRQGTYLGREECEDCHEGEAKAIGLGHHASVMAAKQLLGCETCHGPGFKHGRDEDNEPSLITLPEALPPKAQIAICGQCHADQIMGHGGDPLGFLTAGKGCTDCHNVHEKIPPIQHPDLFFSLHAQTMNSAKPVGASTCVKCHPGRDQTLRHSGHAKMALPASEAGCETCHGNGSLHVTTLGLSRLITRPDTAFDGKQTCRNCHAKVHPLLSQDLTCFTCHQIHSHTATQKPNETEPLSFAATLKVWQARNQQNDARLSGTNRDCVSCHAPAFHVLHETHLHGTSHKSLHGTYHDSLGRLDTPLAVGCGACHDGASEHAQSGGRVELVKSMRDSNAQQQMETCGKCHSKNDSLRHAALGQHQRNEVTCLTCHSPAGRIGKTREDAQRRCTSCHQRAAAEFKMPHHHPVPEGRMGCTDCHNPHSARPKIRDLELRHQRCVECHKQYRGPFVFAHNASRSDGCVTCHSPHGATNRRMLKQHSTQQNCLQCHADFPSFHDQTIGAVFTNCLNCHTQIHGSSHDRFLFR